MPSSHNTHRQGTRTARRIAAALAAGLGLTLAPTGALLQPLVRWLPAPQSEIADAPPILPPAAQLAALTTDSVRLERWGNAPPSLAWTETALELIVKYRQNPLRAARVLAYVNVAAHDALAECEARGCGDTARRVSMHVAAGRMLEHLYPEEQPGRLRALALGASAAVVAVHGEGADVAPSWRVGAATARSAIERALFDGSDAEWDVTDRPAAGPVIWRAAPPLLAHNPLEAAAPRWQTWVLKSGADVDVAEPPAFGSERYRAQTEEVLRTARTLTPEQRRIAEDWNLGLGTVTPAGVWNKRAVELARSRGLTLRDTSRLFAAMNVAMYDAFIACWHAKLKWWTVRPVSVIRDSLDPQFTPLLVTPGFPAYPSGHATISAAAAEVLAAYLPGERAALEAAAAQAAESRLYGGIHFRADNDEGLALGRRIGQRVAARALLSAGAQPMHAILPKKPANTLDRGMGFEGAFPPAGRAND